jgi:molecular chaperone DnaK (HSP70)
MSTALNNIKDRVYPRVKIDSIELIGGASRIPFIQQIVSNIFGF